MYGAIALGAMTALGIPGAVGSVAKTVDQTLGRDILNNKARARKSMMAQADLSGVMASQGFDGIVEQLSLDTALNAGPLKIRGQASSLSIEDQIFAANLVRANQSVFQQSSQSPATNYGDILARVGML